MVKHIQKIYKLKKVKLKMRMKIDLKNKMVLIEALKFNEKYKDLIQNKNIFLFYN